MPRLVAVFLIFLFIPVACGPVAISPKSQINHLRSLIDDFLADKDIYKKIAAHALGDPSVAYHMFLICGRDCLFQSRAGPINLFDMVFKEGKYSFASLESHRDHVLSLLAQLKVPSDESLVFSDRKVKVHELIDESVGNLYLPNEGGAIENDMELGWSLCAYEAYLPASSVLTNKNGQETTVGRLAAHAMLNPHFNSFTEQGTHELMGLGCVYQKLLALPAVGKKMVDQTLANILHEFTGKKIEEYLATLDKNGDFHLQFQEFEQMQDYGKIGGKHSVQVAVGGHVLSAIGQIYSLEEIVSDPHILLACERLLFHMRNIHKELLPVKTPFGVTGKISYWGAYQRDSYAHGYEALTLVAQKLALSQDQGRNDDKSNF